MRSIEEKLNLRIELKIGLTAFLLIVIFSLSRDVSILGSLQRGLVGFVILLVWVVIIRAISDWLRKSKE
ncbi:hypothetical protein DRZ78_02245 [Candidatus Aerophobetes bacterium]|uniref:Uncharacterized protein n=1 Tax=Aerophobetes bacterium TaxID=2030807 RepID=A0A662D0H7_UNCAE|nr:MAG: hypothetical protein DRZ78_02245 [Candidatus Aerophobetes bacterium]